MREPAHRPSSVLSEPRRSKGEKVVASVKRIHTLSDDNYIISNSLRSQVPSQQFISQHMIVCI